MSGNRKVSPEEKLQAVYEYLAGKGSQKAIAQKYGIGRTPFRQWIQKYQTFGESAFIKTGHNASYSVEFKQKVIEAYLSGKGSFKDCKKLTEIIIEKHRNGPQGVVELYFKGECTKFLNLEDGDSPVKKEANGNSEEAKSVIKEEIRSDYESEEVEEETSNPETNVEVKSIDQEIFG